MNILIIGANGGIGKKMVEQSLEAGHNVKAILRTPAKLTLSHSLLEVVKGDVMKPGTFEKHLAGIDVVISAIGEKMNHPTTLYSQGNNNLLMAMGKSGVSRAFFISAQAIEISPAQPFFIRLLTKYLVQKLFAHGYSDQRVMEKLIKDSSINWTIMRPPQLTNKPATGIYRYAINHFLKNCLRISRADVAHFMIHHLTDASTFKGVIEIAN